MSKWPQGHIRVTGLHLALVVGLVACSDAPERFSVHRTAANAWIEQDNPEKARIELQNALKISPEHAQAHFELGQVLASLERWQEAAGQYTRVLQLDSQHTGAHLELARVYLSGRKLEESTNHIQAVLAQNSTHGEAIALRATVHLLAGEIDNALADAERAFRTSRFSPKPAALYATILANSGRLDEAFRVVTTTLSVHTDDPGLWEMRARLAYRRGDLRGAAEALRHILTLSPTRQDLRHTLANFLIELNEPTQAEALLEAGIEVSNGADSDLVRLVEHVVRIRGVAAGIDRVRTLLASNPNSAALRFALAELHQRNNSPEAARALYVDLIEHEPDAPDALRARRLLALFHLRRGEMEAALALVNAVLARNPLDQNALLLRSSIALKLNDPETAIVRLRTALRDHPDDHYAWRLLARAHVLNNERAQAQDILLRTIGEAPDDLDAHFLLLEVLDQSVPVPAQQRIRERVLAGAKSLLDNRLHATPQDAEARLARGKVAMLAGRPDDAAADLNVLVGNGYRLGETHRLLARAAILRQDDAAARIHFESAVRHSPSSLPAWTDYIGWLTQGGQSELALASIERALVQQPRSLALLLAKARLQRKSNAWPPLLETARRLQVLAPARPDGFFLEGIALQAMGRDGASIERFRSALERSPNAVAPQVALARSYFGQGQTAQATQLLDNALKSAPNDLAALNLLGEILLAEGQVARAETLFERALAVRPDWDLAQLNLSRARLERGDQTAALSALSSQTTDSNNLRTSYDVALTYERLGRWPQAAEQYEAILRKWPDQVVAANNLAMVLARPEHRTDAALARAWQLTETFREAKHTYLRDTRAWLRFLRGDAALAATELRAVVKDEPEVPVFRYHYALALEGAGDKQQAITELTRALSSNVAFAEREDAEVVLARWRAN